jgi:O-antigen ligase
MGDIGLLGFASYIFLIFKLLRICLEIGVMRSSLSLISLGVYIFVLSFFGEWLENPPAIAFAIIIFASDNFNRKVFSK